MDEKLVEKAQEWLLSTHYLVIRPHFNVESWHIAEFAEIMLDEVAAKFARRAHACNVEALSSGLSAYANQGKAWRGAADVIRSMMAQ